MASSLSLFSVLMCLTTAEAQVPDAVPPAPQPVPVDPALPPEPAVPVEPPPSAIAPGSVDPLAPQPVPIAEVPVVEAPAEPPALPDRLSVGKGDGFWQPSALLQSWLFFNKVEDDKTNSTFRLRRAELKIKGEIAPKLVGYTIMIDPAKLLAARDVDVNGSTTDETVTVLQPGGTDGSILQDFFITFISDYADVSVGQFKIPVSLEGLQSSSRLLFPERSLVSRAFGDRRELGVKVEKKIGDFFYYYAGLFNGSNINRLDNDREKDVGLRVEVYPIKGLTLGVVGYATALGDREEAVRDRIEGDVRLELGDAILQAEYIRAWDGPEDARLKGQGVYGALAYTFIERLQPVVRIGFHDADTDADDDGKRTHYEACLNYLLRSHEAKLSLSVGHFSPDSDPSSTEVTLLTQVAF